MPRITFQPDLRNVEVRPGDQLLAAAWKAGVGIKSICGGRGKCGCCVVEIDATPGGTGALEPASAAERDLLPKDVPGKIYRLACQCEVNGDLTVSIPPESQAVKNAPRKPFTVTRVAARPVTSRLVLEIDPPNTQPPRPLDERILEAATRATGRRRVDLPLSTVADFSQHHGFDRAHEVTATLYRERKVIQLRPGRHERQCGIAVDVGTTSMVMFLCDLGSGEILAMRTAANPQGMYGEDVISRMTHIQKDPTTLPTMQRLVVEELNGLVADACAANDLSPEDVVDAVIVGNPTMQHILLGINPEPLGRGPYQPVWSGGVEVEAASLGLTVAARAHVFVFPMVNGFIGGDTLAALLTRGPEFYRGTQLLVDIGTNGEVVLAHNGRLTATSCATGPVYEGAHIRCGMRAAPGAIERVWVGANGEIRCATIGEREKGRVRPVGLCGSGVISSVSALVKGGLIGIDGSLAPPGHHPSLCCNDSARSEEVVLVPDRRSHTGRNIVLTQQDVRSVQLGKSALRAGIEILMAASGVTTLDRVHLAGTFGNHLEPEDILNIGLLPPLPVERVRSIGNAAGDGARMALFNRFHRGRAIALARRLTVLELSGRADFQEMFITHTELAPAPLA